VILGERIVSEAIDRAVPEVEDSMAVRLLHLVVSHHGRSGSGMHVGPAMVEAVLLHHADELDSEMACFDDAAAGSAVMEERWTDSTNPFGRSLLVPYGPPGDRARGGGRVLPRERCSTIT
jgi:3'-5' exoribonuclease